MMSFELHISILNQRHNGNVLNQRLVTSPRTGILHVCLSLKRQNLTTLASGEKTISVPHSLQGLLFRSDFMGYYMRG